MKRSKIIYYLKIIVISFIIFRIISFITIGYLYQHEVADVYLPLAFGIVLSYWYGPIILIPMFLNATINSYYWGHESIISWPIFASAEVITVFLSWYLFIKLLKGKYWIPDLKYLLEFLFFGIICPLTFDLIYINFLLIHFKEVDVTKFWIRFSDSFIGDYMAVSSFSVFFLYFFSGFIGNNKSIKHHWRGNLDNYINKLSGIGSTKFFFISISIIISFFVLTYHFEFTRYWYLYGLLLLVVSLKYGFGVTIIASLILFFALYIFPAFAHSGFVAEHYEKKNLIEVFSGFTLLFTFSLVLGRDVSDKRELILLEEELVTQIRHSRHKLQSANKSLLSARDYFSQLFESSLNLILIIKEENGVIQNINGEGYRILKFDSSDIISKEVFVWDVMRGKSWEEICNQEEGSDLKKLEISLIRKGSTPILCEVSTKRVSIENSTHYILNAIDITKKRVSEEKIRKSNEEKIELNQKISEYKMMALRSAMNPHFIFNCLNSIQFYIVRNEKKEAVHYLLLFSKLVRNVLDNSTRNMVSLAKELDILRNYTYLEQMRFNDKFDVKFDIDEEIDLEDTEIPPMLLQPYVENAIQHGLSNKIRKGMLMIDIQMEGENLKCIIKDNGVGRKYNKIMKTNNPLVTSHKSLGMSVTSDRLTIINKEGQIGVKVIDLEDEHNRPLGTQVELLIKID